MMWKLQMTARLAAVMVGNVVPYGSPGVVQNQGELWSVWVSPGADADEHGRVLALFPDQRQPAGAAFRFLTPAPAPITLFLYEDR
jgi:hypothetical protein